MYQFCFNPVFHSVIQWLKQRCHDHKNQHFPNWIFICPDTDIGIDQIRNEFEKDEEADYAKKFHHPGLHFDPAEKKNK